MVVLAVDVGGDGPADGHVAGAGGHRDEPAPRHEAPHQRVEAHARAHAHPPRVEVGVEHRVVTVTSSTMPPAHGGVLEADLDAG